MDQYDEVILYKLYEQLSVGDGDRVLLSFIFVNFLLSNIFPRITGRLMGLGVAIKTGGVVGKGIKGRKLG